MEVITMNELKQEFYNALGRYDSSIADEHWSDFVAIHATDNNVTVADYAAYVTELMDYSEGLNIW
jgi:hypothetical protein